MNYSIFTLCTKNYKDAYEFVIDSWLKTKVSHIYIYTDDPTWSSTNSRITIIPFFKPSSDWIINVGRKVKILEDILIKQKGNMIFVDIDCYILEDIGHVFDKDFDLAVVRFETNKIISSGIWFLRNSDKLKKMCKQWFEAQKKLKFNKNLCIPHAGSYAQHAFDQIIRLAHKNKMYAIEQLSYDIYSLKIKNRDNLNNRLAQKVQNRMINKLKSNTIKILHFYNNSYRNKKLVKKVFDILKDDNV